MNFSSIYLLDVGFNGFFNNLNYQLFVLSISNQTEIRLLVGNNSSFFKWYVGLSQHTICCIFVLLRIKSILNQVLKIVLFV